MHILYKFPVRLCKKNWHHSKNWFTWLYHIAESNKQTNFKKVESCNEFCNLLACKLKRPHWWYLLTRTKQSHRMNWRSYYTLYGVIIKVMNVIHVDVNHTEPIRATAWTKGDQQGVRRLVARGPQVHFLIILTYLLIYFMAQNPSWEANRLSASQEIPHSLWDPRVHFTAFTSSRHLSLS